VLHEGLIICASIFSVFLGFEAHRRSEPFLRYVSRFIFSCGVFTPASAAVDLNRFQCLRYALAIASAFSLYLSQSMLGSEGFNRIIVRDLMFLCFLECAGYILMDIGVCWRLFLYVGMVSDSMFHFRRVIISAGARTMSIVDFVFMYVGSCVGDKKVRLFDVIKWCIISPFFLRFCW